MTKRGGYLVAWLALLAVSALAWGLAAWRGLLIAALAYSVGYWWGVLHA